MLLTATHTNTATSTLVGTDYPRGFTKVDGATRLVYLGHAQGRCIDCEFPLGNERKHPVDENGLTVLHGGERMKLITE